MNMLDELAKQLTARRKSLGMEQKDMYMRIGMKQQQYQRIEAGQDIKLSTFLRVLDGLNLSLSIVPKEELIKDISSIGDSQLQDDSDDLDFWFGDKFDNKDKS